MWQGGGGGCHSKDVQIVYASQVLQRHLPEEALADAQKGVQTTCCRATRRGFVQGSSTEGGLSHLLPTNAWEIVVVHDASTRDRSVRANL